MQLQIKQKAWDYFILVGRFLLGWTFLRYGFGKITESQFGLDASAMATPIEDLSLFQLGWYLFEQEHFNTFVGISQILCGGLLIWNRTALIGAFLFLPLVGNILMVDLTIMPPLMAKTFAWRLSAYILLDLLILWHTGKGCISFGRPFKLAWERNLIFHSGLIYHCRF